MSFLYKLLSPNYEKKIAPEAFEDLPKLIDEHFYQGRYSRDICDIVCAHKILTSNTEYTRTRGPKNVGNMLNSMTGDCEDQSVLLCSMYKALGLTPALLVLKNNDGDGHLSTLVEISGEIESKTDELRLFYYDHFDEYHDTISIENLEGRSWFISGSTMTSYVGDISGLEQSGYISRSSETRWEWTDMKYATIVE